MRHWMFFSAIIVLTLVPGVGMTQINWEKYPANPVLDLGTEGSWDDAHVSHPSVLFDGSEYHVWYVGDHGSQRGIGYARSMDGAVWERYPGNPVLQDGIGDAWDGDFVSQPSVLYDGTQYHMWYTGYDGTHTRIGYATSADGVVWNKHASNPVLDLGDSGSWDAVGVSSPTVLLENSTYHMWYTGYDGTNMRIGYATSDNGVVWDPHASNPVMDLGANGSWDAVGVSSPTVLLEGTTPRMWYTGHDGVHMRIGYATSRIPGDTSGNGTISAYDAALILQFVVGLIDEFPAQQLSAPKGIQTLPSYCVSLPQRSAKEGERIHVSLTIQDATGLFAGGIRVGYDPTVLKAVEVSPLMLLSGSYWQANTRLPGEVRFAFATLNPLRGGGDLFTITFEVLPCTEGQVTPLTLFEVDFNHSVSVKHQNGSVSISPLAPRLLPNYPNPFNPLTTIRYQLPEASEVGLAVYDVLGRKVQVLVDGFEEAGSRSVVWDAKEVASGLYFVRMQTGDFVGVRKMVVVR